MYTNKILPHKNFEHNNSNKKLVSFRAYEKTFMIIKPDAYERNLNTIIENNILASGLKISKSFEGIASKNKMRKNYISKQNKSFFEDWIKFLTSGKLKAIVSITLDNEFVVHDIKVIEGEKGLFIAMPSKKSADGEFRDIAHPINSSTREMIQTIILDRYRQSLTEEA